MTERASQILLAAKLERGERIASRVEHHVGMCELLARQFMTPEPGETLVLTDPRHPTAYLGYHIDGDVRRPFVLATSPDAYAFGAPSDDVAGQVSTSADARRTVAGLMRRHVHARR
jgi:hypothetical protein